MKKAYEGAARELDTPCSLRTASSETMRTDSLTELSTKQNVLPRSREECQKLSQQQRQILVRNADSLLRTYEGASEATYGVLFELSRTTLYGPEIHSLVLRFIFRDMDRGQVDGPARALVALSLDEIQAFFAGLSADETSQWDRHSQVDLRSPSQLPTAGFWYALIKAMAEAHDTLDSARALALLRAHDHKPFALLFAADPSKQNPSPIDLVLSYVRASYNDCLPQVRDGDPNPPESDLDLEVYAAYFSACPEPLLSVLLDRIIGGINPRALRAYRAHDFATLLDTAPYLRPRFPSTQDPANGFHGRISTINQHPASPYLFFALRLATWSAAARAGLVKRGVVQTIEALYDMPDEIVIETDYGEQVVSSISQHIMLQLCYLLLGSLSDCYDPSGSTLMEELRADIVSYSRSMLRRLFAPGRETRDD